MGEHAVARVEDVPEGGRLITTVEGRSIGIVRHRGRYYALRNRCAHQGGPACEGAILPTLRAVVNERGRTDEFFDADRMVVCCPWHGWEYELETGVLVADRTRRIATYEVRVENGDVYVKV